MMKKIITFLLFNFALLPLFAQTGLNKFNLRYNETDSRYEVWMLPDVTAGPGSLVQFVIGNRITIVFPSAASDNTASSVTGVLGGISWSDTNNLYSVPDMPGFDLHAFQNSSDANIQYTAGNETLLFHFVMPDGCVNGARLWDNDTDPALVSGANFDNSIELLDLIGGGGSVASTFDGTFGSNPTCPTLSNNAFSKSEFSLTPNPNNGQFEISSVLPLGETTITIYNITGQQVYRAQRDSFGTTALRLDLAQQLAQGAYLINIESAGNASILKMVVN